MTSSTTPPAEDAGIVSVGIVVPMYRDWESVSKLLAHLSALEQKQAAGPRFVLSVVIVDDSPQFSEPARLVVPDEMASRVQQLRLKRNVGHQRAIAIGLCHAVRHSSCQYFVVMDGDGEDAPEDVFRLIHEAQRWDRNRVVFAERAKRAEAAWFRAGYVVYRLLHWALTSHRIRFGNFSVIPRELARIVIASPDLWSHYAAAVVRLRIPYELVSTTRAARYAGRSTMSPVMLIAHGLTAVAVFYDIATVRLTLAATTAALGSAALFSAAQVFTGGPAALMFQIGAAWLIALALVTISLQQTLTMMRTKTHLEVTPTVDAPSLISR